MKTAKPEPHFRREQAPALRGVAGHCICLRIAAGGSRRPTRDCLREQVLPSVCHPERSDSGVEPQGAPLARDLAWQKYGKAKRSGGTANSGGRSHRV